MIAQALCWVSRVCWRHTCFFPSFMVGKRRALPSLHLHFVVQYKFFVIIIIIIIIYLSIGINVRFAAMMADVGNGLLWHIGGHSRTWKQPVTKRTRDQKKVSPLSKLYYPNYITLIWLVVALVTVVSCHIPKQVSSSNHKYRRSTITWVQSSVLFHSRRYGKLQLC